MLSQDYSKTTIGIYVRQLRTLFNEAVDQGILKRENTTPSDDVNTRYLQVVLSNALYKSKTLLKSITINRSAGRNSGQKTSGYFLISPMASIQKTLRF
jgi:Phage integrase SAM-like domain